ncbi:NFATC2-interacting protein-like isoform X2 [Sphaeramia orbicularis]|uniref:NFATC2-interacting protein isoform X2 n=1 Tax=Sphaeramia orbicularis TaxID=375764 RepID=UPI00118021FF|nr:NFATC2-interacting protein-like isoform X2 [Sphaeramia orbicularis]XP_029996691.1 NFATC2-interacting protein-like isoform X2 [Sphaeramia orbicularis]
MAEKISSNETQPVKPPPKRRRILDPSAIVPVPVYSNKVNTSLQLRAPALADAHNTDDAAEDGLWTRFSSGQTPASTAAFIDSDDEAERKEEEPTADGKRDTVRSPSPPPPQSPAHRPSRKATRKISEINRRLQVVNSLLSPEHQDRRPSRRRGQPGRQDATNTNNADVVIVDSDDDVIAVTPDVTPDSPPYTPSVREIPLKVRCRTDVHKIHVLSSTLLSTVLAQLSVKLKVPPNRLLLMREEVELPIDSTVGELGLGIADIIECVVMAAEVEDATDGSVITVRLQTKDRDSVQEFSLHREAALGSVFSQYLSSMSAGARGNVRFHFDGGKVMANQTPAQLDMEDGDIIEVWT